MSFHNEAALKPNGNVFDHRTQIRQRLGAVPPSFRVVFVRRGETLLRRYIGNAVSSISRSSAPAKPKMIVGKANAQIRAGAPELQCRIALVIEPVGPRMQLRVMF